MMLAASRSPSGGGCGIVLNTIYDDNFDCGSSPDTAGTRFSGANPWTPYHIADVTAVTASQTGGILSLNNGSYFGGGNPRGYLQSLPGGSGDWRFRIKFTPTVIRPSFPASGLMLRESSSDKQLACFCNGSFEARRISSWGTWFGNYVYGGVAGGVGVVTYIEVERIGGAIEFRQTFNTVDGEDTTTALSTGGSTGSHAQTADFTTAPDQFGIFIVDDDADFDWVKRIL